MSSLPDLLLIQLFNRNLWLEQMRLRCPSSIYMGVGKLTGFRWIINSRGYANIVSFDDPECVVYGLIYKLSPADVAALDENEGVPVAYTKEIMTIEFWKSPAGAAVDISWSEWQKADVSKPGQPMSMLVYIDRQRVQDDVPKKEYVHRMNMGITDALAMGVPTTYVQEHMRPFIPLSVSKEFENLAKEQAASFKDEVDR